MKNVILAMLLLLLVWGCKAPKKAVYTTQNTLSNKTKANIEVSGGIARLQNTLTGTTSNYTDDTYTELVRVEYDTEKPVLETTGKPPVKAETTLRKTSAAKASIEESQTVETFTDSTVNLTDRSQYNIRQTEQVKHTEADRSQTLKYVFYNLAALAIIVLVLWLMSKKTGWWGKIVNLIRELF